MKPLAIITGPLFHHLDHLAPLCYFFQCPLLTDDVQTYTLGKTYYPNVDIQYNPINLETIYQQYDLIFLSTKWAKSALDSIYQIAPTKKRMRFCFCPHGQSDKGLYNQEMICQSHQDILLLYGQKQKKFLEKHHLLTPCQNYFIIGNFRLAYYQIMKKTAQKMMLNLLQLPKKTKTILYAPTWNDFETKTTFLDTWSDLLKELPREYTLIIKIHPLLEKYFPAHVYQALSQHQTQPNIHVFLDLPLIYPLLNQIDIYLGDYSAIGYDFLYFNRPLFFPWHQKSTPSSSRHPHPFCKSVLPKNRPTTTRT